MTKRLPILFFGDVVLSFFALSLAYIVRFGDTTSLLDFLSSESGKLFLVVSVIVFSSFLVELYNNENNFGKKEFLLKILMALTISFFVLSSLFYMMPFVRFGRGSFILSLGIFGVCQFLWHICYRALRNHPGLSRRVVVLGTGQLAKTIGDIITATNHQHVLTGYIAASNEPVYVPAESIVGNGNGIIETLRNERAHKLVVSLSERRGVFPLQDVLTCKFSGIEVIDAPSFYEDVTGKLLIENITPSWLIFSRGFKLTSLVRVHKRIFDIAFSLMNLAIALPFIPLIALAIKVDSRGPVFIRQARVGEKEKVFVLYKFRTMREDAEMSTGPLWAAKNDSRVTRIGRFLRTSRLDEIPQLYNVLKGDMSFIGPRPERPEFVENLKKIIPFYSERHFIRPGLTGWAQIRYSYGASVEDAIEKLRYDLYYIKNLSPLLDMLIIIDTVKVVLFGKGAR